MRLNPGALILCKGSLRGIWYVKPIILIKEIRYTPGSSRGVGIEHNGNSDSFSRIECNFSAESFNISPVIYYLMVVELKDTPSQTIVCFFQ